eukprot:gnl/Dysnectes_brevis/2077_a2406_1847.p1 GENE.gnl/Dysnectes_brevis/2077_a2406_1847~~gnl/Dysnectes_brevis/2077_a2406_1847.p1  ORF type:complete len:206 (-),score=15.96 gnl/Dysnectes_brevis/2077_a2406_1847:39-656(-)
MSDSSCPGLTSDTTLVPLNTLVMLLNETFSYLKCFPGSQDVIGKKFHNIGSSVGRMYSQHLTREYLYDSSKGRILFPSNPKQVVKFISKRFWKSLFGVHVRTVRADDYSTYFEIEVPPVIRVFPTATPQQSDCNLYQELILKFFSGLIHGAFLGIGFRANVKCSLSRAGHSGQTDMAPTDVLEGEDCCMIFTLYLHSLGPSQLSI